MRMLAICGLLAVIFGLFLILFWPNSSSSPTKKGSGEGRSTAQSRKNRPALTNLPKLEAVNEGKPAARREITQPPLISSPANGPAVPPADSEPNEVGSLIQAFEGETSDATIAARNKEAIEDTIVALQKELKNPPKVSDLECRARHCRLTFIGQISEVSQMIDAILDDRGKMAGAANMMLHRENDEIQVYFGFTAQVRQEPTRLVPD